jgi:hypothetical protein
MLNLSLSGSHWPFFIGVIKKPPSYREIIIKRHKKTGIKLACPLGVPNYFQGIRLIISICIVFFCIVEIVWLCGRVKYEASISLASWNQCCLPAYIRRASWCLRDGHDYSKAAIG